VPRRQSVDLGANNAFEKIDSLPRQFQRPEQEAPRVQDDLDAAAAQRRHPVDRQRFGEGAVDNTRADRRQHARRIGAFARPPETSFRQPGDALAGRLGDLKRECAVVILDQSDKAP
jgi:hypothetical protein